MANYNKVVRFALSDFGAAGTNAVSAAAAVNLTNAEIIAKQEQSVFGLLLRGSYSVNGICHDYSGNMYITDADKSCILKVEEGGGTVNDATVSSVTPRISLFAGLPGTSGDVLGVTGALNVAGTSSGTAGVARFALPKGIACDKSGNIFVCDSENNKIKVISGGTVKLVAGSTKGNTDGVGSAAQFNNPVAIAVDKAGTLYVVDAGNHSIRKIKGGTVTTIAGNGTAGDLENSSVVDTTGVSPTYAFIAALNNPTSLAVDAKGDVYVLDAGNYKIKKITPDGWISHFSGSVIANGTDDLGTKGDVVTNPLLTYAYNCKYDSLTDCDVDESGNLYVIDEGNLGRGNNTRLIKVDYDGRPGVIHDFGTAAASNYIVRGVMCTPGQKVLVTIATTVGEMSSSSSSFDSSSSESSSSSS